MQINDLVDLKDAFVRDFWREEDLLTMLSKDRKLTRTRLTKRTASNGNFSIDQANEELTQVIKDAL